MAQEDAVTGGTAPTAQDYQQAITWLRSFYLRSIHNNTPAADLTGFQSTILGLTHAAGLQATVDKRTEAIEQLMDWRSNVTVAFGHAGGTFYDDVPKHIAALRADLTTCQHALAEAERQRDASEAVLLSEIQTSTRDLAALRAEAPRLTAEYDEYRAISVKEGQLANAEIHRLTEENAVLRTAIEASEERAQAIGDWASRIRVAADGIACAANDARTDAGLPTVDKS